MSHPIVLTREQVRILLHMTGLDRGPKQYRNHYASHGGGTVMADLVALEGMGLLERGTPSPGPAALGPMLFFHCTAAGIEEAWSRSPFKRRRPEEGET